MSKAVAYLRFSTKEQMDEYNNQKMKELLKKSSDSTHSMARIMLEKSKEGGKLNGTK
jgi:DNA invertase Pin-like site-specific DNA recombinase